jgi:hypothetical protein
MTQTGCAWPGAPVGETTPIIDMLQPPFSWDAVSGTPTYRIQVATDATFMSPTVNATTAETISATGVYSLPSWQKLAKGTRYY